MKTETITASEYRQKYAPACRNLRAKAQTHIKGRMNGTEAKFALFLQSGEEHVASYKFECVKLRLADKTYYTPDFMVIMEDGSIIFYEVKGFWRDDARVKIKVAAEQYPEFEFVAVQQVNGDGWSFEFF